MESRHILGGCLLLLIGLFLGILATYAYLSLPLIDEYNAKVAKITQNGTLACFDISKLGGGDISEYAAVNKYHIAEYCANEGSRYTNRSITIS